MGTMRDQNDQVFRRWLLQRFKECVGRILVHLIRWIDHDHPITMVKRHETEVLYHLSHLIDLDDLTHFLRLEGCEIGVCPSLKEMATLTDPTG